MAIALPASDFELPLTVSNSQVAQLVIGCKKGATTHYDKGLDIAVPQFGMGCSIIGLEQDKPTTDMLYKDMRNPDTRQIWRIVCRMKKKPVFISWKTSDLPQDMTFVIQLPNGKPVDMRTQQRLTLTTSSTVVITGEPAAKTEKH